ncbi:MAG: hypothetical protein JW939_05320 [Candidatus Thermoplasmatota archaeon]|nr:hypothetical protein [Candidatus Thermoplasmatota archaeon]
MNETDSDETQHLTLKVVKSAIGSVDSGVARIHASHLDSFENDDMELVELRAGKKQKVVRLVSDRFAKKDHVVLREGDMEDLEVEEEDEVELYPYKKLSEDLKENWQKLRDRFRKKDEEEEK